MTGIDSNILVQRADIDHPSFVPTVAALDAEIRNGHTLVLAPSVIAEFLHIITDSRRLTEPLSMVAALNWLEAFQKNPNVGLAFPTEASLRQASSWMRQFSLGRKRILDTQLAATYHAHGCNRLITSNPADFQIFGVFEIIVP